jgi:hypothetical protein
VRELPIHFGQIAAPVRTPVGIGAARQIAGDVDRTHTPIVVGSIENPAILVDRKVVRPRTIDVEKRNLTR